MLLCDSVVSYQSGYSYLICYVVALSVFWFAFDAHVSFFKLPFFEGAEIIEGQYIITLHIDACFNFEMNTK